jgi:hypothetical protein
MAQLQLSRDELVSLVHDIRNSAGRSERAHDALVTRLEMAVDHPGASDIIFWDDRFFNATDEQVVDELLGYKPICL